MAVRKKELEKRNAELAEQIAALVEEKKQLENRTATKEAVADEVRNFYANFLDRCSVVCEWTMQARMSTKDIEDQKRIMQKLYQKYSGAMTLYCVFFGDWEWHCRYQGDRRWSNWTDYSILSTEEMNAKPERAEISAKYHRLQAEYHEWKKAIEEKEPKW